MILNRTFSWRAAVAATVLLAWMFGPTPAEAKVTETQVRTAITRLDGIIRQTLRVTGVPGLAVAIVHNDEVVFLKGYGVRKAGTSLPVTPDTVFQLASISKPVTSTVLAGLVGDGLIGWNDPIRRFDPNFRLSDARATGLVTFRDLLSHRSGLPGHAGDLLEDIGFSRSQILSRLRFYPLGDRFRKAYAYTNFGITEAAVAAAKSTGLPWEQLAARRLFERAGMDSTSARFVDYWRSPEKAYGHVPRRRDFVPDGHWVNRYVRDPDAQSPGGGVSSTVRDMARWMRLQLAGGRLDDQQIINARALAQTHRPVMRTDTGGTYGLCWNVGASHDRLQLAHSGEFLLGFRTEVVLIPSEKLGIIVLVNAAPNGIPEGINRDFLDLVFDGKRSRNWVRFANEQFEEITAEDLVGDGTNYSAKPAPVSAARSLGQYAGLYVSPVYGTLRVKVSGDRLVMELGPARVRLPLRHYNGDHFYFRTKGESQTGLSGAIFRESGGRITSVVVNSLDRQGLGEFRRP